MQFITDVLPAMILFVALMGGIVKISNIGDTPETIVYESWIPSSINEDGVIIMKKKGEE